MASVVRCFVSTASFCCCNALLSSCCGNDKPSSVAPGASSGRKRSVVLLVVSVALQLAFQFGLAPWFVDNDASWTTQFIADIWLDDCSKALESDTATATAKTDNANDLLTSCVGRAGNYRVALVTTVFFLLTAVATACKATANREAWPAKIILYLLAIVASIFVPASPVLTPIYLYAAIVGGALFIAFQQVVILDVARSWNDRWVQKSNQAEAKERGSGKKWLFAILTSCALLYVASVAVLVYLFFEFTGCSTNNAVIAMTLIFCILLTTAQMTGDKGSLLSSACICAWATFLCYDAVSKNPNPDCNPRLGETSPSRIVLGLAVTLLSLAWTGWSYTAGDMWTIGSNLERAPDEDGGAMLDSETGRRAVAGVVVTSATTNITEGSTVHGATATSTGEKAVNETKAASRDMSKHLWKLNVVLAAVSCWSAMTLTEWGQVQTNGTVANATMGRTSMWIIIASQWLVLSLYLWTLVAPRLFPNRDFSS